MNCKLCGSNVKDKSEFCSECGFKIEKPLMEEKHSYVDICLRFTKTAFKVPMMTSTELNKWINDKGTFIYMAIIIVISAIISIGSINVIMFKIRDAIDIMVYTLSTVVPRMGLFYSTGEIGFKYFIFEILTSVIYIGSFTLVIIGVYKLGLKKKIKWVECLKLMIFPLSILAIGKIVVLIIALLNIRLGIGAYMMLLFVVGILTVIGFINRLGKEVAVIYGVPSLYALSVGLTGYIWINLIV